MIKKIKKILRYPVWEKSRGCSVRVYLIIVIIKTCIINPTKSKRITFALKIFIFTFYTDIKFGGNWSTSGAYFVDYLP